MGKNIEGCCAARHKVEDAINQNLVKELHESVAEMIGGIIVQRTIALRVISNRVISAHRLVDHSVVICDWGCVVDFPGSSISKYVHLPKVETVDFFSRVQDQLLVVCTVETDGQKAILLHSTIKSDATKRYPVEASFEAFQILGDILFGADASGSISIWRLGDSLVPITTIENVGRVLMMKVASSKSSHGAPVALLGIVHRSGNVNVFQLGTEDKVSHIVSFSLNSALNFPSPVFTAALFLNPVSGDHFSNIVVALEFTSQQGVVSNVVSQWMVVDGAFKLQRQHSLQCNQDIRQLHFGPFGNGPLLCFDEKFMHILNLDGSSWDAHEIEAPISCINLKSSAVAIFENGKLKSLPIAIHNKFD